MHSFSTTLRVSEFAYIYKTNLNIQMVEDLFKTIFIIHRKGIPFT